MGALFHLLLPHLDAAVPILGEEGLPELLRTIRVGPLPDDQEGGFLPERSEGVGRGGARLVADGTPSWLQSGDGFDHRPEVCRGGAAATADDGNAELVDEPGVMVGEFVGGEVVAHRPIHHFRQSGVRDHRDGHSRPFRQVANVFGHLGRSGCAIQPEDRDAERIDGRQGGADLGPRQHSPGCLDGDLCLYRDLAARVLHCPSGSVDGRLQTQEVELRLDDEQIDPALEQGHRLVHVRISEVCVPDLAECWEPGPRTDRSGNPPGPVTRRELVGHFSGEAGCSEIQLVDAVRDAVLAERDGKASEAVGLDDVDACVEKGGVDVTDEPGSGDVEDLIAPFEVRPAEVVLGEPRLLQRRAHGAVVDDDPGSGGFDICMHGLPHMAHPTSPAPDTRRSDVCRARGLPLDHIRGATPERESVRHPRPCGEKSPRYGGFTFLKDREGVMCAGMRRLPL